MPDNSAVMVYAQAGGVGDVPDQDSVSAGRVWPRAYAADFDEVAIGIGDGQEVPAGVAQPSQLVKLGQLGGLHRVTSRWGPAGTGSGHPYRPES